MKRSRAFGGPIIVWVMREQEFKIKFSKHGALSPVPSYRKCETQLEKYDEAFLSHMFNVIAYYIIQQKIC